MAPNQPPKVTPQPTEPVGIAQGPAISSFGPAGLLAVIAVSIAVGAGGLRALERIEAMQLAGPPDLVIGEIPAFRASEFLMPSRLSAIPWHPGPTVVDQGLSHSDVILHGPLLANIWPSSCEDCSHSFKAWAAVESEVRSIVGSITNLTSEPCDRPSMSKWHLDMNMGFAPSELVALEVTRFETILIDAGGRVRWRDDPTRTGFLDRLRGAWQTLASEQQAAPEDTLVGETFLHVTERVTRARAPELQACFRGYERLVVPVSWRVNGGGAASDVRIAEPPLARSDVGVCIVNSITSWRFPVSNAQSYSPTVKATFVFEYDEMRDHHRFPLVDNFRPR